MLTDPSKLFRPEAIDAKNSDGMGRIIIARPISFTLLTSLILVFLIIVVLILSIATYARQELVVGRLVPAGDFARVYAPRSGVIKEVYVKEGEVIQQGQALALIQSETFTDDGSSLSEVIIEELEKTQNFLNQSIISEQTLLASAMEQSQMQIQAKSNELKQLTKLINTYRQRVDISQKDFNRHQELNQKGQLSNLEINRLHKELLSEKIELKRLEKDQDTLISLITQLKHDQKQIPIQHQKSITELQLRLADTRKTLAESSTDGQILVKAPITGVISGLEDRKGRQVTMVSPLLTILPKSGGLQAELYVPTRAIGFVNPGSEVKLRYDAFPYQKFGTYSGNITSISKSVFLGNNLEGYNGNDKTLYKLIVDINEQQVNAFNKDFNLQSGMQLSAYLMGERRSLLEWFFEPIYAYFRKA